MGKIVAPEQVRLKFISVSKQALEIGAQRAQSQVPLAQADCPEAFVGRSEARIDQALELRFRAFVDELGACFDDSLLFDPDGLDDC